MITVGRGYKMIRDRMLKNRRKVQASINRNNARKAIDDFQVVCNNLLDDIDEINYNLGLLAETDAERLIEHLDNYNYPDEDVEGEVLSYLEDARQVRNDLERALEIISKEIDEAAERVK